MLVCAYVRAACACVCMSDYPVAVLLRIGSRVCVYVFVVCVVVCGVCMIVISSRSSEHWLLLTVNECASVCASV